MMKHGRHHEVLEAKKREIEVMIISAEDLKDVKRIGKMRCYAVAYIDPEHKVSTRIDEDGGINPAWHQKLVLAADDELLSSVLAAITVEIYCHGHIREKLVGTARILIPDLLKGGDPANPSDNPIQCIAVQVRRPSGRPQGILNIWVPPTGRFLLHSSSLSFSRKDAEVTPLEEDAHNGGAPEENEKEKKRRKEMYRAAPTGRVPAMLHPIVLLPLPLLLLLFARRRIEFLLPLPKK